jgi:DNA-binding transcriptional LysR family regulator
VGLRVNNGDVMRDAAVAGLGIALLPTFIAGDAVRSGALQAIDVGLQAATESIYVAHPEGRRASPKLRALRAVPQGCLWRAALLLLGGAHPFRFAAGVVICAPRAGRN